MKSMKTRLGLVALGIVAVSSFSLMIASSNISLKADLSNAVQNMEKVYFLRNISSNVESGVILTNSGNFVKIDTRGGDGVDKNIIIEGSGNFVNSVNDFNSKGSHILGGEGNQINGSYDTIIGGLQNKISSGDYSTIGGGNHNIITGNYNVIAGGSENKIISGNYSTVPGGKNNKINGSYSVALGVNNVVSGDYSVALGSGSKVIADRSFLWTDGNQEGELRVNDVFAIVSKSGMAINTATPHDFAKLTVSGSLVINKGNNFVCSEDTKGAIVATGTDGMVCLCSCDGSGRNSLYEGCESWCNVGKKQPKCGIIQKICPDVGKNYYSGGCIDGKVIEGTGSYFVDTGNMVHRTCQSDDGNLQACSGVVTNNCGEAGVYVCDLSNIILTNTTGSFRPANDDILPGKLFAEADMVGDALCAGYCYSNSHPGARWTVKYDEMNRQYCSLLGCEATWISGFNFPSTGSEEGIIEVESTNTKLWDYEDGWEECKGLAVCDYGIYSLYSDKYQCEYKCGKTETGNSYSGYYYDRRFGNGVTVVGTREDSLNGICSRDLYCDKGKIIFSGDESCQNNNLCSAYSTGGFNIPSISVGTSGQVYRTVTNLSGGCSLPYVCYETGLRIGSETCTFNCMGTKPSLSSAEFGDSRFYDIDYIPKNWTHVETNLLQSCQFKCRTDYHLEGNSCVPNVPNGDYVCNAPSVIGGALEIFRDSNENLTGNIDGKAYTYSDAEEAYNRGEKCIFVCSRNNSPEADYNEERNSCTVTQNAYLCPQEGGLDMVGKCVSEDGMELVMGYNEDGEEGYEDDGVISWWYCGDNQLCQMCSDGTKYMEGEQNGGCVKDCKRFSCPYDGYSLNYDNICELKGKVCIKRNSYKYSKCFGEDVGESAQGGYNGSAYYYYLQYDSSNNKWYDYQNRYEYSIDTLNSSSFIDSIDFSGCILKYMGGSVIDGGYELICQKYPKIDESCPLVEICRNVEVDSMWDDYLTRYYPGNEDCYKGGVIKDIDFSNIFLEYRAFQGLWGSNIAPFGTCALGTINYNTIGWLRASFIKYFAGDSWWYYGSQPHQMSNYSSVTNGGDRYGPYTEIFLDEPEFVYDGDLIIDFKDTCSWTQFTDFSNTTCISTPVVPVLGYELKPQCRQYKQYTCSGTLPRGARLNENGMVPVSNEEYRCSATDTGACVYHCPEGWVCNEDGDGCEEVGEIGLHCSDIMHKCVDSNGELFSGYYETSMDTIDSYDPYYLSDYFTAWKCMTGNIYEDPSSIDCYMNLRNLNDQCGPGYYTQDQLSSVERCGERGGDGWFLESEQGKEECNKCVRYACPSGKYDNGKLWTSSTSCDGEIVGYHGDDACKKCAELPPHYGKVFTIYFPFDTYNTEYYNFEVCKSQTGKYQLCRQNWCKTTGQAMYGDSAKICGYDVGEKSCFCDVYADDF